jgi:acyl-coenzyme A thioesterase PaaI-like protein
VTHTTEQIPSSETVSPGSPGASGSVGASGSPATAPASCATGGSDAIVLARPHKRSLFERAEAFVSRLSSKNNFWHRVTSLIWLPYAFRSGIKMKRLDGETFEAVLPFRRFNRNWYNAMAGAALLGNAEIAGGMYVFGICGGDYTVVCKHLEYKFLRPCFGPARYRITPREDVHELVKQGGEFNITVTLDVQQQLNKPGEKAKRVGRANATFHVTPKLHHKQKKIARAKAE